MQIDKDQAPKHLRDKGQPTQHTQAQQRMPSQRGANRDAERLGRRSPKELFSKFGGCTGGL